MTPNAAMGSTNAHCAIRFDSGGDSPTYWDKHGESAPVTVTYTFTSALRIANETSTVPLLPPTTGLAVVDSTPGLNITAPSCMTHVPGSTNKVLVGQRNGQIWLIDNIRSATPNRTLFMTLPAYDGGNEMGLKGIALHPQFATSRQFFITYNLRISNAAGGTRTFTALVDGPMRYFRLKMEEE